MEKISWIRSFLNRHKAVVRKKSQRRALETYKAAKHQIELVLRHFRNVYQAAAKAQIQRHVAKTGSIVPGFVRFHNILQQELSSSIGLSEYLLEERDGILFVKPLGVSLEHVNASMRIALDETPIAPDSPVLIAYTTQNSTSLARGKASIRTLLPVLSRDGRVLA